MIANDATSENKKLGKRRRKLQCSHVTIDNAFLFFFPWLLECCSGVERVNTDQENQMVTVTGMFVNPMRVLRRVKKIKKRSELIMPNWIPTEKHSTSNYAAENAKSYSRYPQSSSQVHTQQLYHSPGEDFRGQEFNYPHNFYARPSYHHH
jgi:hypothetical protein